MSLFDCLKKFKVKYFKVAVYIFSSFFVLSLNLKKIRYAGIALSSLVLLFSDITQVNVDATVAFQF